MTSIIVAFSKPENAKYIKNILVKNGYPVHAVCASGSKTLSLAYSLGSGILVCGCKFSDMVWEELRADLPEGFSMLLLALPGQFGASRDGVVCLAMPLKVYELVDTLDMMARSHFKSRKQKAGAHRERSRQEKEMIAQAKALLMDRNHMSEEEAHRYLQKCSMDSGRNLAETSKGIIGLDRS